MVQKKAERRQQWRSPNVKYQMSIESRSSEMGVDEIPISNVKF